MARTPPSQVTPKPLTPQKIVSFRQLLAPSRPGTARLRMNLACTLRLESVLRGNRKYALSVNRLFASDRALALGANERQTEVRGAKTELLRGRDNPTEHKALVATPAIAEPSFTSPSPPAATVTGQASASVGVLPDISPATPSFAHEVIAKIAVWRKSQAPSLTISLRGAISGEVLLERAGRGAVAVSLATQLSKGDESKLRTELNEKLSEQGLHVARFNVSKS